MTRAFLVLLLGALAGCASTSLSEVTGSVASGGGLFASAPQAPALRVPIFVASTRRGERGAASDLVSDGAAHFSLISVSLPPGHKPGEIERPTFGDPNPGRDFTLASRRGLDAEAFGGEVSTHISGRVGSNRDVLLYVHGFRTSLEEARFRLAQIVADGRFGGVPVLFTWPSQNDLFAYGADKEQATASRDALEKLMLTLAHAEGVGRVHILAHSMGAWLTMEALRENAIAGHADLDGKLGDVMLAAPDIDLTVFRQQMARLGEAAHVSVFVSSTDRALSLSGRLTGDRQRVGAMDPNNPRDKAALAALNVRVYDLSHETSGFINHGAYANAPSVIRSIGAQLATPRAGDSNTQAVLDAGIEKAEPVPAAPIGVGVVEATPLPEASQ